MAKEAFNGPILITGIPGIPGFNAFYYFLSKYGANVIGQAPCHTSEISHPQIAFLDAEDKEGLVALFKRHSFRFVIDASGCCALKSCEYNPAMAKLVNTDFGVRIMELAREYDIPLIRFSSDLVFDGVASGNYTEQSPVSPVTVYGKTMAEAEKIILDGYGKAAVFRIPLPMGPSLNGHAGAVDWIESRFKKNNPATLYYDEVRSNIYIQDVLLVLEHFLDNFTPGLFHLGGPAPLTLYQIAQIINRLGNYPPELLHGCFRHEAGPVPPRAGNVSMNSKKLAKLLPKGSIRPWPHSPDLIPDQREWHFKRPSLFGPDSIPKLLYSYDEAKNPRSPLNWWSLKVPLGACQV